MTLKAALGAFLALVFSTVAVAQENSPAQSFAQDYTPVKTRIGDIRSLLDGDTIENDVFNANFLNAVPPAQFRGFTRQMREQHGPVEKVEIEQLLSPHAARLRIVFRDSIASGLIDVEPAPPHFVAGLRITGFQSRGGSLTETSSQIAALPGQQGLLIKRLNGDAETLVELNADDRFSIASTFKLYILAELDKSVRSGERKWTDVVALGPKSHPSGISQDWPDASPVTLHTLATLMISRSDNSATDTLIRVIGQEKLADIVRATGHRQPDWISPMLMTRQSSALKMPQHRAARESFETSGASARADLLRQKDSELKLSDIDPVRLTSKPGYIDTIGWFASPADIVNLLDWIRLNASPETRAILAINPGIDPAIAGLHSYLGYKGGSEAGVMSMNFLIKSRSGDDYAVSSHWNNSADPLNEARFVALMTRVVNLLATR
ncbi:serine hydrolase [Parasphingorhabdus sp.]|uniref:serine hydrolase n=2 Tax=Parasphingorhabdus sp. TaxID=2709688 RepID=UPI0032649C24